MTTKRSKENYHESAADQHHHAAHFHREASQHFEAGKDREHWAHQAMAAHGHTLRALTHGHEALKQYDTLESAQPSIYPATPGTVVRFPANAREAAESMATNLQGTQWHGVAADHHEAAARHHDEASRYCIEKNFDLAAKEAEMAHRHALQSVFYSYEVVKQFDRNAELDAAAQDIMNWTERKMIG
jgi:hypothetical protein